MRTVAQCVCSLCESFKFLQDRRSGESRYFTRPYTILPDRQILCDYAKLWYMYIKLILLLLQNILHWFSIKYIQTVRSFCNFLRTNFRFFNRRPVPFVEKIYQPDSKFTSKNWRSCDFRIDCVCDRYSNTTFVLSVSAPVALKHF